MRCSFFNGLMMKKFSLFMIFFIVAFEIFAQTPGGLEKFNELYKNDQFNEAIEYLKQMNDKEMSHDKKAYYSALCFSRLQQYDQAIANFKIAIAEENKSPDLFYEYGQALYANNNLRDARTAFLKSASKNFNYTASIYYVAYISELLEDYIVAKYNYARLIKDSRTDKKILQVSLYQYSRILLLLMRQEEKTLIRLEKNLINYIPRYILPLLNHALEVDKTSPLAKEIAERIRSLQTEFNLDPNILSNGRKISPYRFFGYVAQRIKYDDNVNYTKKKSALLETEAYTKYDIVYRKTMIFSPDIKATYTRYNNQKDSDIYQNDALTLNADLRNRFEHSLNKRPASFLVDAEYSRFSKDWQKSHHQNYYYQTLAWAVGEQVGLFQSGETTFKFKRSHYTDITNYVNSYTSSITIEQYNYLKDGQHLLLTTLDRSANDYYDNKYLNTDAYLLRFYYYMFELVPSYTLQLGLATTLTDTKEQKAQRGTEITLNPSLDLSKMLSDKWRISVNYNYVNNSSKLSSYAYHRQIFGGELNYTF